MLVNIAGLLFLNCVKDVSFINSNSPTNAPTTARNGSTQSPSTIPFIESSVEAAPAPDFIQVGKTYNCGMSPSLSLGGYDDRDITIVSIDKESGWIQTKTGNWFNTSLIPRCSETSAK